jgi:hypothetical protein
MPPARGKSNGFKGHFFDLAARELKSWPEREIG